MPLPSLCTPMVSSSTSGSTAGAQGVVTAPEFCPNPACRYHARDLASRYQWYVRHGRFHTRARGSIQRFRCCFCGKTCSTQTFSIHYWTHYSNDLGWLLGYLGSCSGMRQAARMAGVTHRVIQNRYRRLARNALSLMDCALGTVSLREQLAMDGFESFTRSQYHPNNITHVCGSRSQFIYAAVHTLLRRKGAMTDGQKRHRELIDAVWKPQTTILDDCTKLLADVAPSIDAACTGSEKPLVLDTDKHSAYRKAIASVPQLAARLREGSLVHRRTSSRKGRTTRNPLFAVNYVDRQLRLNLAEYVRETFRQGREVNSQMERMAIFMAIHNFATPHRIDGRARPRNVSTHADVAGIGNEDLEWYLKRMLTHRHLRSHTTGSHSWINRIWGHEYANPPSVRLKKGILRQRRVALAPSQIPAYLKA